MQLTANVCLMSVTNPENSLFNDLISEMKTVIAGKLAYILFLSTEALCPTIDLLGQQATILLWVNCSITMSRTVYSFLPASAVLAPTNANYCTD